MDELITKYVVVYGPLALGWAFYWFERRMNYEAQKKLLDLYASSTAALVSFNLLLDERLPRK